jgi:hypothetical protein
MTFSGGLSQLLPDATTRPGDRHLRKPPTLRALEPISVLHGLRHRLRFRVGVYPRLPRIVQIVGLPTLSLVHMDVLIYK